MTKKEVQELLYTLINDDAAIAGTYGCDYLDKKNCTDIYYRDGVLDVHFDKDVKRRFKIHVEEL